MAVKLRLTRMGAKEKPFYRIVASDSRRPRDGKYLELIGTYDPSRNPAEIKIDEEKALKWLSVGATPSDTVRSFLRAEGIMKKFADSKAKKAPKKEEKKEAPKKTTTTKKATPAKKTTTAKTTTKKATPAKKTTTKKTEKKDK